MGNMCWNEFKYGSAERKEQFEIRPNLSIWVEWLEIHSHTGSSVCVAVQTSGMDGWLKSEQNCNLNEAEV